MDNNTEQQSFHGLGISPGLLKRISDLGFVQPTPIQHKAIPIATSGEDVVGIAQTGSGKTLAFAIPMIQLVLATKKTGLILLPTRELAVQVDETFRKVGGTFGVKTALVMGGTSAHIQLRQLRARPQIIVATPGRLIDYIERRQVALSDIGMLVLDEADRMLDMGFAPQLKRILAVVPTDRQTMLFSATMPDEIASMAQAYMKKPLRIEVARPGATADKIDQEVIMVSKDGKLHLLENLLGQYRGSVLVFTRTKHGAKKVAQKIRQLGHSADEIHSNRSQVQRQKALKGFANGTYRVLVATDIASRGIDVQNIELVINFDLPEQAEDYTHRIGRTGRAGRSGKAISFAAPDQKGDILQIQRLINMVLPIKSPSGEALESIKKQDHGFSGSGRGRGGHGGAHGGGRPRHHGGGGQAQGRRFGGHNRRGRGR